MDAIANKGVVIPAGSTLDNCPGLISRIETGGGGPTPEFGGVFTSLIISTENKQSGNLGGVQQTEQAYVPTNNIKWSITAPNSINISGFNRLEWKFKFYLRTDPDGNQFNYLFGSNNDQQLVFVQFDSVSTCTFTLKKANNSNINSWNIGAVTKWEWHFVDFILDRSTSKIILKIDGTNKINESIDFSQIDTTSITPSYGCGYTGTSCWFRYGVTIGREMSLKIDDEEKF